MTTFSAGSATSQMQHYRAITLAETRSLPLDALYVGFPGNNYFYKIDRIDLVLPNAILRYTDTKGDPSACEIDADGNSVYFGTHRLFVREGALLPGTAYSDYNDWLTPPPPFEEPKCNSSEPEPEPATKSITDITRRFCR